MISFTIRKELVAVLTMVSVCVACRDSTLEVEGYKCADLVEADVYYGRPAADRLAEIRTYTLEKQYAVFICGMQFVRPPAWNVAQPLAERGKAAAGFLEMKLRSVKDDSTIRDIVALVDEMDASGTYNAAEDQNLMHALESAISRMRDERWKQQSNERLQRIRKEQVKRSPMQ